MPDDAVQPIPMRLLCPSCGALHIDEGEFATKAHHSHACQHCGEVWRPALVPTVGVQFLPGFKNEEPGGPGANRFGEALKRGLENHWMVEQRDQTIVELRASVANQGKTIDDLREQVRAYQAGVKVHTAIRDGQSKTIEALRAERDRLKQENDEHAICAVHQHEVKHLTSTISKQLVTIDALRAENANLKPESSFSPGWIDELRRTIADLWSYKHQVGELGVLRERFRALATAAITFRERGIAVKTTIDRDDRMACDALNLAIDEIAGLEDLKMLRERIQRANVSRSRWEMAYLTLLKAATAVAERKLRNHNGIDHDDHMALSSLHAALADVDRVRIADTEKQ